MYKDDYTLEDYFRVADDCAAQIKNKLQKRYDELEEQRSAINDGYRFEDLYIQWAKVDYEEELIRSLLKHLDESALKMKNDIKERWNKARESAQKTSKTLETESGRQNN